MGDTKFQLPTVRVEIDGQIHYLTEASARRLYEQLAEVFQNDHQEACDELTETAIDHDRAVGCV